MHTSKISKGGWVDIEIIPLLAFSFIDTLNQYFNLNYQIEN